MILGEREKARILSVLDKIKDPEIGISIVKLRMVGSLELDGDKLTVYLKLTVPGCPLKDKLEGDIKTELAKEGYGSVVVNFTQMDREELEGVKATVRQSAKEMPSPIVKYERGSIKNIIAVYSAKGGVGKSTLVALLALTATAMGMKTAILDCDISGPSISTIFGVNEKIYLDEQNRFKPASFKDIKFISIDLLTDAPVLIWRGPLVSGAIQQMYSNTSWGDLDLLILDMPPGTSDAPLTTFQSIPISKMVLVTTPHELSHVVGKKTIFMANILKVPISGIIENMTYMTCPDCGKQIKLEQKTFDTISGFPILAKLPVIPHLKENVINSITDQEITAQLRSALNKLIE